MLDVKYVWLLTKYGMTRDFSVFFRKFNTFGRGSCSTSPGVALSPMKISNPFSGWSFITHPAYSNTKSTYWGPENAIGNWVALIIRTEIHIIKVCECEVNILYYSKKLQIIPHPSAEDKTQCGGGQRGENRAVWNDGQGAEGLADAGCGSEEAGPTQDTWGHYAELSHPPAHSHGCLACEGEAAPSCHWSVIKGKWLRYWIQGSHWWEITEKKMIWMYLSYLQITLK